MFNWMKLKGQEKLQAAKRSYGFLKVNFTRLGIPDPALTLRAPMDEFEDALNAADDKNTGEAATRRKDEAEAAFDKAFGNYGTKQCGALFCLPLCCLLYFRRKGE